MITSFIGYGTVIGALAAAAAWLIDAANGRLGLARRAGWVAAIAATLLLPPLATVMQTPPKADAPTRAGLQQTRTGVASASAGQWLQLPELRETRLGTRSVETFAAGAWATASLSLLAFYAWSAWRLARRSRRWKTFRLDASDIAVADDIGPAVYGWWRPRVVFPAWLLAAPMRTQRLALSHELQHIRMLDPQMMGASMLLSALFPWNLPLLWMLRRLRFALEVDCDARVLRQGADASQYGHALLFVSQRQARAPLAAIALIERTSQLERRINIMLTAPHRFRALAAGLCLALAGSCILAATQVEVPARVADEVPLKPSPDGSTALKLGQRFEQVLQERYPGLLESATGGEAGTAIVVLRLNRDWSVDKAAQVLSPDPAGRVQLDESIFEAIGVARNDVPYLGTMGMQSPTDPGKVLLVAYTEHPQANKPFVSYLFPDTRAVDRAIFQRHFPQAARSGVSAGTSLWVLLDRDGHVLRSGQEAVSPKNLNRLLETRFAGIKTQGVTVTPIVDDTNQPVKDLGGKPLQLMSVWLAPDSPPPA